MRHIEDRFLWKRTKIRREEYTRSLIFHVSHDPRCMSLGGIYVTRFARAIGTIVCRRISHVDSVDDLSSLTDKLEGALKETDGADAKELAMSEEDKKRIAEEVGDGW